MKTLFQCLCLITDVDECASSDENECDPNAACNNTEGSYVCRCLDGYRGDGRNCTGKYFLNLFIFGIDFLTLVVLTFLFACLMSLFQATKPPYLHVLLLITDIDECTSPETNECDPNALCNNTEGSYICRCLSGFQGDGKNCTGNYLLIHVLVLSNTSQLKIISVVTLQPSSQAVLHLVVQTRVARNVMESLFVSVIPATKVTDTTVQVSLLLKKFALSVKNNGIMLNEKRI